MLSRFAQDDLQTKCCSYDDNIKLNFYLNNKIYIYIFSKHGQKLNMSKKARRLKICQLTRIVQATMSYCRPGQCGIDLTLPEGPYNQTYYIDDVQRAFHTGYE